MSDVLPPVLPDSDAQSPTPHDPSSRRRARQKPPSSVDVAIIGAGLGGLAAGAYLARAGLSVACFESHYVAGGCATQFRRKSAQGAYHFDIGLHYIGEAQPGGRIPSLLAELGTQVDFAQLDPQGFDTLVFPDFQFRIPSSIELYRERLIAQFPKERRGIDRYLALLQAVLRVSLQAQGSTPSLKLLLSLRTDALTLARYRNRPIADFLDSCTQDPHLRAVFLGQNGDYGLPPREVSTMLHMGLAGHYFLGAYYPKGGGQVIADRIAASLEASGGGIFLRHPVEKILIREGKAVGVRLAARTASDPPQEVSARVVLSNADLLLTLQQLVGPQHLPSSWQARVETFHMADAIFLTFLGVTADLPQKGMRRSNYWQFDGYDIDAYYAASRRATPDGFLQTHGCYITSATLKDPEHASHHAPPGVHNLEIMALVPGTPSLWAGSPSSVATWQYRKQDHYQALKASLEEQLIGRLERMFPGTSRTIVYRESATPLSHMRYTRATGGTGYGLAATPDQFLDKRPGARGPLPGLYLAGASTRSGHGIIGALLSGRQAARRIAADLQRPLDLPSALTTAPH